MGTCAVSLLDREPHQRLLNAGLASYFEVGRRGAHYAAERVTGQADPGLAARRQRVPRQGARRRLAGIGDPKGSLNPTGQTPSYLGRLLQSSRFHTSSVPSA
jgi:hypothetical protein